MKMKDWECNHDKTCPFRASSPYAYTCGPEGCPLANLSDEEAEMEFDDFLKEWERHNDAYAEQVSRNYEHDRRIERRGQLWEDVWEDPRVEKARDKVESLEAQMNLLALAMCTMSAGTHVDKMFGYIDEDKHNANLKRVAAGEEALKNMNVRLEELTKEMENEHVLAFNRMAEEEGV